MMIEPLRILIVDSDLKLSADIREIFQDEGYELEFCDGSSPAIKSLDQNLFHFVLINAALDGKAQQEIMAYINRRCSGLEFFHVFWYKRLPDSVQGAQSENKQGALISLTLIKRTINRLSHSIREQSRDKEIQRETLKMAKEFQESNQRLMELDKKKNSCLAGVTHELRTPLTIVNGYQKLLLSESFGPLSEKQKHLLRESSRNCHRVIKMVNSILERCRLESNSVEFHFRHGSYLKSLQNLLDQMRDYIEESGLVLDVELPDEDLELTFDPNAMEQAQINLISNAVKFTPPPGKITVRCEKRPDGILTQVMDTGVGIEADEIDRVFDEFNDVGRQYGEKKGAGLGLSICKKIIQSHGGRIWVENRTGRGSCFSFLLPRESDNVVIQP